MVALKKSDTQIVYNIDKSIYSIEIIHKCIYWYTDIYIPQVELLDHLSVQLSLTKKEGVYSTEEINELNNRLSIDLIDYKTRDIISKETKNIRELIVAKAFMYSDEFDQPPPGDVSDPVGFQP